VTKAEFIEWVNKLESTLPVGEWTASGVPVWPFIRFELYASAFYPKVPEIGPGGGWTRFITRLRGLAAWVRASVLDRRSNVPADQRSEAVFLAYSIGVQPLVGEKRYNPLLAPYVALLQREGGRALVWEMSPYGEYNIPRYTPSHYIQPWLGFLRVACRLTRRRDRLSLNGWDEFVKRVAVAQLTSRYLDPDVIARDAYFVRRLADGFKRRLLRAAPSLGFTADYGLFEQAFCLACGELGILSVDIQHGIQGDLHPIYGSWGRVPDEGYAVKPDVHWCWDDASAAAINRWAGSSSGRHRAIVGGDAWREAWLNGTDDFVRGFDEEIARRKQENPADVHVLVTLDSIGDVLPPFVLEAFGRSPPTWCYWVRLHPVNQRARRPLAAELLRSGGFRSMDLDAVAQLPLHGLLRHMDVHLTISLSSVILEAEAFGVPSIACDPEAAEFYSPQLATGMLRVARTPSEVTEAVRELAGLRRTRHSPQRPGPTEALRSLLEKKWSVFPSSALR
jgi:hypothetical protein